MEYRKIPKDPNQSVSTIGIGGANLHEFTPQGLSGMLDYALEQGVNLIDTAVSYSQSLDMLGIALGGRREKCESAYKNKPDRRVNGYQ